MPRAEREHRMTVRNRGVIDEDRLGKNPLFDVVGSQEPFQLILRLLFRPAVLLELDTQSGLAVRSKSHQQQGQRKSSESTHQSLPFAPNTYGIRKAFREFLQFRTLTVDRFSG